MEELGIAEHRNPIFGDRNIGRPREELIILPVADAAMPQGFAEDKLDTGVPGADCCHSFMALCGSQGIHSFTLRLLFVQLSLLSTPLLVFIKRQTLFEGLGRFPQRRL